MAKSQRPVVMDKLSSSEGRQQTPPYIKKILEQDKANKLKFTSDCPTLVIYLFIQEVENYTNSVEATIAHSISQKWYI